MDTVPEQIPGLGAQKAESDRESEVHLAFEAVTEREGGLGGSLGWTAGQSPGQSQNCLEGTMPKHSLQDYS